MRWFGLLFGRRLLWWCLGLFLGRTLRWASRRFGCLQSVILEVLAFCFWCNLAPFRRCLWGSFWSGSLIGSLSLVNWQCIFCYTFLHTGFLSPPKNWRISTIGVLQKLQSTRLIYFSARSEWCSRWRRKGSDSNNDFDKNHKLMTFSENKFLLSGLQEPTECWYYRIMQLDARSQKCIMRQCRGCFGLGQVSSVELELIKMKLISMCLLWVEKFGSHQICCISRLCVWMLGEAELQVLT